MQCNAPGLGCRNGLISRIGCSSFCLRRETVNCFCPVGLVVGSMLTCLVGRMESRLAFIFFSGKFENRCLTSDIQNA